MQINQRGLDLIKYYEGCKLEAYPDPASPLAHELRKPESERVEDWEKLSGSPWTIGYGSTGPDVKQGMIIDQFEAEARLKRDLVRFELGTSAALEVDITDCQFSALVCFAFNLGLGTLIHSTLLKEVNDGDFEGAAAEFNKWTKAGGQEMPGLVKRRNAERVLFLSKD